MILSIAGDTEVTELWRQIVTKIWEETQIIKFIAYASLFLFCAVPANSFLI